MKREKLKEINERLKDIWKPPYSKEELRIYNVIIEILEAILED